jgi:hypothetical protein
LKVGSGPEHAVVQVRPRQFMAKEREEKDEETDSDKQNA